MTAVAAEMMVVVAVTAAAVLLLEQLRCVAVDARITAAVMIYAVAVTAAFTAPAAVAA